MIVWMSTLRKGVSYHLLDSGKRTKCGKYVGWTEDADPPKKGHVLPIVRAVDDFAAHVCGTCAGTAVKVEPPSARSSLARPGSRWGQV